MKRVKNLRMRLAVTYGFLCGFFFALTVWGRDALILSMNKVSLPYIKLIPGLIIASGAGAIFGWIRFKTESNLIKTITWLLFVILLIGMIIWVPVFITPKLLTILRPELKSLLDYPLPASLDAIILMAIFAVVLGVGFCAIFEEPLTEGYISSSFSFNKFKFVLIILLIMGTAASLTDQLIEKNLRDPQVVLSSLFDFAQANYGKEVDKKVARQFHLSALKELDQSVQANPSMILISYDETMGMVDVLVDLDGKEAFCSLFYNQPSRCYWLDNRTLRRPIRLLDG